jgi:hypothetical protein
MNHSAHSTFSGFHPPNMDLRENPHA